MFLYTDIETLPARDKKKIDEVTKSLKPPSNYKNPEVIEKWFTENTAEAVAKTSFDPAYGEIACIGWNYIGNDVDISECPSQMSMNEKLMIETFIHGVSQVVGTHHPLVVTHNGNGFDLPFIRKRCIVHGIKLPAWFPRDLKPWGTETFDTMLQWDAKSYISMDRLAKLFGISGKGDVDGSMVAEMWANGKQQEVVDYCIKGDVPTLREIHEHMMKALS